MKNSIIGILIIIVAFLSFKSCGLSEDLHERPITPTSIAAEEVSRQVDEYGAERVIYKEAEPIIRMMMNNAKVDSVIQIVGIRNQQLKAYSQINASIVAENVSLKKKVGKDTVYIFKDKWLDLTFRQDKDSATFDMVYSLELNDINYFKKKNIFSKKIGYHEIWSPDPRVKINGVDKLRIASPLRNSITFDLRTDYNFKYNESTTGIGIEYSTRNLDYRGAYMYDYESGKFYPSARVSFKFLEF